VHPDAPAATVQGLGVYITYSSICDGNNIEATDAAPADHTTPVDSSSKWKSYTYGPFTLSPAYDAGMSKKQGTVCATGTNEKIGTVTIGNHVDVVSADVPAESGSFEFNGDSLSKNDRIMVTSCRAQCGAAHTKASPSVHCPRAWKSFPPVASPLDSDAFFCHMERFCLADESDQGHFTVAELADVNGHRCELLTQSSGFLQHLDDDESPALCVTEATCKELCAGKAGCVGIDIHRWGDRCYLRKDKCARDAAKGRLGIDPAYKFCVNENTLTSTPADTSTDFDALDSVTSLTNVTLTRLGRRRLDLGEEEFGTDRAGSNVFENIAFTEAGKFQFCYCHAASAAGGVCSDVSDYDQSVAFVQVSDKFELYGGACMAGLTDACAAT